MQPESLSKRLLITSLAWSVFALIATGIVLASTFRASVEQRFDDTLSVHLTNLIGELAETQDLSAASPDLGEPRFRLPLSGWYWQVRAIADGTTISTSQSLVGDEVVLPDGARAIGPGMFVQSNASGPMGEPLRAVARRVAFGDGQWLLVSVAGASTSIKEDTARFAQRLALVLGLFAATLVALTLLQVRFGLRPLKELGRELEAIREGKQRFVAGTYPIEVQPVADALNTLISANHATLERARQHVGNLAHALKTPLSVMTNDATGDAPLARSVREQTQIMQRQVRAYLERAQMAARERVIGTVTDVAPVLDRLVRAMARLGERRGIAVALDRPDGVRFAGEQQDFEEIVGNLVDNALKWAKSRVAITVLVQPAEKTLTLEIADDGPGLSPAACEEVLSRGKRLDTSKPGSGLGLSIVAELVSLYGGNLILSRARSGGLAATVRLPLA